MFSSEVEIFVTVVFRIGFTHRSWMMESGMGRRGRRRKKIKEEKNK